jgi:plasmid maintenance system antidote protein VapI
VEQRGGRMLELWGIESFRDVRGHWVKLGEAGDLWVKLGEARDLWVKLEEAGDLWVKIGEAGDLWVKLEEARDLWMKLGEAGDLWVKLGDSGDLWVKLEEAGDLWMKILDASRFSTSVSFQPSTSSFTSQLILSPPRHTSSHLTQIPSPQPATPSKLPRPSKTFKTFPFISFNQNFKVLRPLKVVLGHHRLPTIKLRHHFPRRISTIFNFLLLFYSNCVLF